MLSRPWGPASTKEVGPGGMGSFGAVARCASMRRTRANGACGLVRMHAANVTGFFRLRSLQLFGSVLPACMAHLRAPVRRTGAGPPEGRARVHSTSVRGFPFPTLAHEVGLAASCAFVRWVLHIHTDVADSYFPPDVHLYRNSRGARADVCDLVRRARANLCDRRGWMRADNASVLRRAFCYGVGRWICAAA